MLKSCFKNVRFTHNAIISPRGPWPRENSFPKDADSVGFLAFKGGVGGDYHLCANKGEGPCKKASPYAHAGTDGRDLGVDIDALERATAGVE